MPSPARGSPFHSLAVIMDLRSLVTLSFRLVGLYLVITTLVSVPALLVSQHPYPGEGWASLILYVVLGLVLVWLPGRITNRVLRIGKADGESQLSFEQVLRVSLIVLGFYFAVNGLVWFVFAYAKAQVFYDVVKPFANSRGPGLNPEDFAVLSARALEFLLGVCLWLANRPIARITQSIGDDH